MIVTISRAVAVNLYQEIINLRPQWHSPELDKGNIKVVITAAASDGVELSQHHTNKQQRRILADRLKDPQDSLNLVIVCDMWLTGFDAPCLHTLYMDKPMKGHSLMQAIARVNRVYLDKPGGLIVDYLGIATELQKALAFYADSGGKGTPALDKEEAINLMLAKLEVVEQLINGCPYQDYFSADTSQKLHNSAKEVMGVEKLRELAIALVQRIRTNASIDWNLKENVRARMKIMVKRLLRQYGYPPDLEALATELVLEQTKLFTEYAVNSL